MQLLLDGHPLEFVAARLRNSSAICDKHYNGVRAKDTRRGGGKPVPFETRYASMFARVEQPRVTHAKEGMRLA